MIKHNGEAEPRHCARIGKEIIRKGTAFPHIRRQSREHRAASLPGPRWNRSLLAGNGKYRVANEAQILWNSTQEHERLARALNIYLDVVNRFPRTRAARDALYTAAVCHERLSNYNPYWREIYEKGLHAGQRMVTYADVKATYPNYQLPRGTFGWQPSTRTVNDGPGWAAAPKPLPRLTKRERLKMFINGLRDRLTSIWDEQGRRWLTEIMIVFGLLFTGRIAARNRKRLRARMAPSSNRTIPAGGELPVVRDVLDRSGRAESTRATQKVPGREAAGIYGTVPGPSQPPRPHKKPGLAFFAGRAFVKSAVDCGVWLGSHVNTQRPQFALRAQSGRGRPRSVAS